MADSIQAEINALVRSLQNIDKEVKKAALPALTKAARPIVTAARNNADISEATHFRYNTSKLVKGIRAPKGQGQIVATYRPGNLKGSIKTMRFRRSNGAVFVGPVVSRNGSGTFGPTSTYEGGIMPSNARSDGYYGRFVEFGAPAIGVPPNPFMKPAADQAGGTSLRLAVNELKDAIEKAGRKEGAKNGVKQ
jgi:HK97 gp10 family phage protein